MVDIILVLMSSFSVSAEAAEGMIAHGQVYIDGHCMRLQWVRHWTRGQLYGRMLKCPRGEYRMMGGRLEAHWEQMRIGQDA